MISSAKNGVQLIVEQCIAHGIRHVVFSPGSRNAPFVIAFDEHPQVTCYVIHDERSAAFFAMGMALQLDEMVAVICTSGTAVLNYYPAIAEAFYQCIPLLVITADRPEEWINQGDGQTIVQKNVFQNHIRYSCHFSETADSPDKRWYIERELAITFSMGNTYWRGPVHINVSLSEPLYQTAKIEVPKTRKFIYSKGSFQLTNADALNCIASLEWGKTVVLCGQLSPDSILLDTLKFFANDSSVAMLVENTSNLIDRSFVHCIDRTLNSISSDELTEFVPDLLISIGGAVVSKKIKTFFRKHPPKQHWKIGHEFPWMDTYQSLTHTFETDATSFFKAINQLNYPKNRSTFGAKWKQKDYLTQSKLPRFLNHVPFSDIKVFETVLDYLPEHVVLHMANSSVVRYCQLFDPISSIIYRSNRGTSGIDGSTSTTVGAASVDPEKCHVLIIGDISFFYDSNALWNAYLPLNLRIFLVNNAGGGIFKIIDGPSSTNQEHYFEAKHSTNAQLLCETFGVTYYQANSIEDIENQMVDFYTMGANNRPKLMEITTSQAANHVILNDYFEAIK